MNLAGARAAIVRNKVPLGAAGAGVVGLIAWRAHTTKGTTKTAASDVTAAAGTSATPSSYSAPNDSTSSDVYNALQPQIEQLKDLFTQQSSPIPVPAAPVSVQEYVRKTGTSRVFAALSDGTLKTIDNADYAAAGAPGFKDLVDTDPVWSRPSATVAAATS